MVALLPNIPAVFGVSPSTSTLLTPPQVSVTGIHRHAFSCAQSPSGISHPVQLIQTPRHVSVATASSLPGLPDFEGRIIQDPDGLKSYAKDFGKFIHRTPTIVFVPKSEQDLVKIVQYARSKNLPVAVRGMGHTTEGQSQIQDGIVIDMAELNKVVKISEGFVRVQGGALWETVINETSKQGQRPNVLPMYFRMTVGGTLSVGGLGDRTFKHGFQIDNVLELKVLTGTGDFVICSPQKDSDLFYGILGGHGQLGIIVEAKYKLTAKPKLTQLAVLQYVSQTQYLQDTKNLAGDPRVAGLRGQANYDESSQTWVYLLGVFCEGDTQQQTEKFLLDAIRSCHPFKKFVQPVSPYEDPNTKPYDQIVKKEGLHKDHHIWSNLFLPAERFDEFLRNALPQVSIRYLPKTPSFPPLHNYIQIEPIRHTTRTNSLFQTPDGVGEDVFFLAGVLYYIKNATDDDVRAALASQKSLRESAIKYGGKAYLIDNLPQNSDEWRRHMGDDGYVVFLALKQKYDPDNLFGAKIGL